MSGTIDAQYARVWFWSDGESPVLTVAEDRLAIRDARSLSRQLGREEVRSLTRAASYLASMTASQEETASQSHGQAKPARFG